MNRLNLFILIILLDGPAMYAMEQPTMNYQSNLQKKSSLATLTEQSKSATIENGTLPENSLTEIAQETKNTQEVKSNQLRTINVYDDEDENPSCCRKCQIACGVVVESCILCCWYLCCRHKQTAND